LIDKVQELVLACGSRVISAYRPGAIIAGTRRSSLHAFHKAVDMSGNPQCMYGLLLTWPGGYSTDYGRMRHIHISYDPDGRREWRARFVHGGGHHTRYARRSHYARLR